LKRKDDQTQKDGVKPGKIKRIDTYIVGTEPIEMAGK
jgi:hypothetical protein